MGKKRKSFSLVKKIVINDIGESDLLINGHLTKELFLLIQNLSFFTKNTEVELCVDDVNEVCGMSLKINELHELVRNLCNVSIVIIMPTKRGYCTVANTVTFKEDGCKLELNESFKFLLTSHAFNKLSDYLDK